MLNKPVLARCDNRSVLVKQNPKAGAPEDWFTESLLSQQGYVGISFDFFVNWRNYGLTREIWIKRVVSSRYQPWPEHDVIAVQRAIEKCDGTAIFTELAQFTLRYGLTLRYQLFKESPDWARQPAPIVTATIDHTGRIAAVTGTPLSELMRQIQLLSGGPVNVGAKGLIYGTTTLECYLSHTKAAWPGDVDLIVTDEAGNALVILEFKKHTLDQPIEDQVLANYYPSPDGRKYDRLAILRDYLSPNLPIVVVYYPTRPNARRLKLELVEGRRGALRSARTQLVDLPDKHDTAAHLRILETIMNMVNP